METTRDLIRFFHCRFENCLSGEKIELDEKQWSRNQIKQRKDEEIIISS